MVLVEGSGAAALASLQRTNPAHDGSLPSLLSLNRLAYFWNQVTEAQSWLCPAVFSPGAALSTVFFPAHFWNPGVYFQSKQQKHMLSLAPWGGAWACLFSVAVAVQRPWRWYSAVTQALPWGCRKRIPRAAAAAGMSSLCMEGPRAKGSQAQGVGKGCRQQAPDSILKAVSLILQGLGHVLALRILVSEGVEQLLCQ